MLVERSLSESARLAREAGADAVVVTGSRTGEPPSIADIESARLGAGEIPVLVGSGLSSSNAAALLSASDGAIVGTSLMVGGGIDRGKVRDLLREAGR
jgi:predicted TIM-barrel enzyme